MIARLTGTILEKRANRLTLDVRDVGYEVIVPLSTYYELGEVGGQASLHIYTHVKEDALTLFGFLSLEEKRLFTRLIQISGIGPKLGVTILSGLAPEELIEAIRAQDLARLNRIPGVGKKTAERLILEMRDKIQAFEGAASPPAVSGPRGILKADVVSALVNLGYAKKEAEARVSRALKAVETDRFEVLLKTALSG